VKRIWEKAGRRQRHERDSEKEEGLRDGDTKERVSC
jgi:hypothetical protein